MPTQEDKRGDIYYGQSGAEILGKELNKQNETLNKLIDEAMLTQQKLESELEHLPRSGHRFSTEESEWTGFCPRCLMTEEEASQKQCFIPNWFFQEIAQARKEAVDIFLKGDGAKQYFEEIIEKARKEENAAWLNHERCNSCGKEIKPDGATDTCTDCLEQN